MSTEREALAADNFEWSSLYSAVSNMMSRLGADGSIQADDINAEAVMDALHRLDAGQFVPGLTPRAALAQPAVPEPMTREFCAAFPGTAAGIINELARQIDAAQEKP